MLPGSIQLISVGQQLYTIADGAFVSAERTVELKVKTQGLANALFAHTGGFLGMQALGLGMQALGLGMQALGLGTLAV